MGAALLRKLVKTKKVIKLARKDHEPYAFYINCL